MKSPNKFDSKLRAKSDQNLHKCSPKQDMSRLPALPMGVPGGITNAGDTQSQYGWTSEPIPVSAVETPRTRELAKLKRFVPMTREEMNARGWKELDILFLSGDAYVDHPSFGIPLLARILIDNGYRVGIIAQPVFPGFSGPKIGRGKRSPASEKEALESIMALGAPRLFLGIGAGVVDSMINNYTANKKVRSDDMYSPGGSGGYRPDYSSVVYSKLARKAFPGCPVIVGGVEVSLRRLAHYDFWQNRIRPSIMMDLDADLLVFGMGERQVLRLAGDLARVVSEAADETGSSESGAIGDEKSVAKGVTKAATDGVAKIVTDGVAKVVNDRRISALSRMKNERGVAYKAERSAVHEIPHRLVLPSFEEVRDDKKKFAKVAYLSELEANPYNAKTLVQAHGKYAVVINPPTMPLTTPELDSFYELPFTKEAHFIYEARARELYPDQPAEAAVAAKIPAAEMIRFSLAVNRGCFGGCSFCAITLHQGRVVQSRSERSILNELKELPKVKGFTGVVSDLGGPTANMYTLRCKSEAVQSKCRKLSCVAPGICPHLVTDHSKQTALLRKARATEGIKKVIIASGLRYDLALRDKEYLREVITHHVGGHLKVAPEHTDPEILRLMKKPGFDVFCEFRDEFEKMSEDAGKEQYLVPYFISSFPGTTEDKMEEVYHWLEDEGWKLQQVQGFIPTPMTLATAMYWSGIDPASKKPLYVAKDYEARKLHQALLQPHKPEHRDILRKFRSKSRAKRDSMKSNAKPEPSRAHRTSHSKS